MLPERSARRLRRRQLASIPKAGRPASVAATGPERAAAVAEMRAAAEAGDQMPFPDAFQAEQTARLAARGEPPNVADVLAIQAELALIAERRAKTSDAEGDRRARRPRQGTATARPRCQRHCSE